MRHRAASVLALAPLLLAGCQGQDGTTEVTGGSSDDDPATVTATTTATATVTETATATATATDEATPSESSQAPTTSAEETQTPTPTDGGSAAPSEGSVPPWSPPGPVEQADSTQGAEPQEITGVRTGLHDGFDRVVLDLSGEEPVLGWFADYVPEAYEDPSGRPLDVEGEAFLQVGVTGIDYLRDAPERYDGSTVPGGSTQVVTDVVFGGLFEGQQQVVVGLRQESDYRVFGLSDPARIVIDVRHP